jgi:hypothetical protein
MSEDATTTNNSSKRKTDRDRHQPDLLPKDQAFFEWLEKLFYDEPEVAHFPEKIEVRVMAGAKKDRYGQILKVYAFAPKKATKVEQEAGAGAGKPTREKLVYMSNEMLYLMQRNCDELRRSQVYGVAVWHLTMETEPYQCWIKRCNPQKRYASENGADDDDDETSDEQRWSTQLLRHQESMVGLLGSGYEGVVDRLDRIVERLLKRNESLEDKNGKLFDMLERALSLEQERIRAAKWDDLKIGATQKGLDLGLALAPPIINQLTGKQAVAGEATFETITLRNFLKTTGEGGQLTKEQADAAFGEFGPPPALALIKPGILSEAQGDIIIGVANGKLAPDELDKLLPGGPSPTTVMSMEQLAALQQVFPPEQLMPLQMIFQARYQKLQSPQKK